MQSLDVVPGAAKESGAGSQQKKTRKIRGLQGLGQIPYHVFCFHAFSWFKTEVERLFFSFFFPFSLSQKRQPQAEVFVFLMKIRLREGRHLNYRQFAFDIKSIFKLNLLTIPEPWLHHIPDQAEKSQGLGTASALALVRCSGDL